MYYKYIIYYLIEYTIYIVYNTTIGTIQILMEGEGVMSTCQKLRDLAPRKRYQVSARAHARRHNNTAETT